MQAEMDQMRMRMTGAALAIAIAVAASASLARQGTRVRGRQGPAERAGVLPGEVVDVGMRFGPVGNETRGAFGLVPAFGSSASAAF